MFRNIVRSITYCTAVAVILVGNSAHASVVISSAPTQNMDCSSGLCVPTAREATLNVTDLENLLAGGSATVSTTGSGGVQANDIVIGSGVTWNSSAVLSLDAYRSIAINRPVVVEGQSGFSIVTNDGGKNGTFSFGREGRVAFSNLASVVTIDGASCTLVDSIAHLASAISSNPAGNYALANDYDASQDGTYSASPIATTLTGSVHGFGNTISNVSIAHPHAHTTAMVSLFAATSATGAIENLRLSKLKYNSLHHKDGLTGGLVADNSGYLFGDQVSGTIKSIEMLGGLTAMNETSAMIVSSSAHVDVVGSATGTTGGLVAKNNGTISRSHWNGTLSGEAAGGLVADNEGAISESYATGTVSAAGGGGLAGGSGTGSVISDSYSTAAVTSSGLAGGFVGNDQSSNATIRNSYSTGAVGSEMDGGFACSTLSSNVRHDYWDVDTSGASFGLCDQGKISGVTGLSTEQLQSGLPPGFSDKIWAQDPNINGGFPYLIKNPPEKK